MRLPRRLFRFLGRRARSQPKSLPRRGPRDLIVILDGTLSSLARGHETNAGLAYKLLRRQVGRQRAVYYEPGLQWRNWRDTASILTGKGINDQVRRAYGWVASQYQPGDRIYLIGYSRGAYAVRSLAGMVGRVGLLRSEAATERNLKALYRLYCGCEDGAMLDRFAKAHCHEEAEVECVAVWDTVKALGIRLPVFWILADRLHGFHDHKLGPHVRAGYHALALNETRLAFAPILWESQPGFTGRLEQRWFRGTHGDVGGQLGGRDRARPLANIPFVWLMERLQTSGLEVPEGWRAAYPRDPLAPSIGSWAGWAKGFWARWPRRTGRDPSETFHTGAKPEAKNRNWFAGLRRPSAR